MPLPNLRRGNEDVVSDKLHEERAKLAEQNGDPWRLPLERVRGKIGDDGIERITTQLLFDILEVPQRSRGAGACRRLAKQWPNSGGRLYGSAGSRAAVILSKSAVTAANRSATSKALHRPRGFGSAAVR